MEISTNDMVDAMAKITAIQEVVCDALDMNEPEFLALVEVILVEVMEDKALERLGARCKRLLLADEYLTLVEEQEHTKATVEKMEHEVEGLWCEEMLLESCVSYPLEGSTAEERKEAKEDYKAIKEAHEEAVVTLDRTKLKLGAITYKIMTFQGKKEV